MPDIFKPRLAYGPFEYPWAYEGWEQANLSHWLPFEVNMSSDCQDFKNMTEQDRYLIGSILRSFTINEIIVGNEYWSNIVGRKFPKPEIQLLAAAFSNAESIHQVAYSYLEETLGIADYTAFLKDEAAKAKIDMMINITTKNRSELALSIAVFSGFVEGINLFSSFITLLNYSRFNKMKGLSTIISWSIMDENSHSNYGCKLFRTIIEENPEIMNDEFKKKIYDAARLSIELEDNFLNQAFKMGNPEGLELQDVKQFLRHRANIKLEQLGLKKNWKNLNQEALQRLSWFDVVSNSNLGHQDFFSGRVTTYMKVSNQQNWDKIWDDVDANKNKITNELDITKELGAAE